MTEFHVGFTGTKRGLTDRQAQLLHDFLERQRVQMEEHLAIQYTSILHHGDCEGADSEAHDIAKDAGWMVEVHPGLDANGGSPHRAHCEARENAHVWRVHSPAPYAERNMNIVMSGHMLIACPGGPEKRRSGTWSTVRAALRVGRPVVLLPPDGDPEMLGMEDHEHDD